MSLQVSQWTRMAAAIGLAGLLAWGTEPIVRVDASPKPEDAALGASDARPGGSSSPAFVENRGQWPEGTLFVARGAGRGVRMERGAIVVERWGEGSGELVRLAFEGASAESKAEGTSRQPGLRHYFLGNDPSAWVRGVRGFASVRVRGLYEGIDLELGWVDGELKYDLLVAPGADLARFVVHVEGVTALEVERDRVRLRTAGGALEQAAGSTWQVEPTGARTPLACRFVERGSERFGLEVEGWDASRPLVIDPALVWSTYLGSPVFNIGDRAYSVGIELASGDVIVVGQTEDAGFPMTAGTFQSPGLKQDCFVARLRAADGALVYSSVVGGSSNQEQALDVAVDPLGRPTVVGVTFSPDFPTTPGAYDESLDGFGSSFLFRLSGAGDQLLYSTILEAGSGASAGGTEAFAVAVASTGSTVVGGRTNGPWVPTPNAPDPVTAGPHDGFLLRLDPTGSTLEWFTFLGGNSMDQVNDLVLDANDDVVATGRTASSDFPTTPGVWQSAWQGSTSSFNAFATRLSADGTTFQWSTFLGGPGSGSIGDDEGHAVGLDALGCVFVAGWTRSSLFPTTRGALQTTWSFNPTFPDTRDGFITRFSPSGSQLLYSTYLGNSGADWISGMAVDPSGIATVTGLGGIDHPITPGAWLENSFAGDFKISRLDPLGGRLLYSTYFGGPLTDQVNAIARTSEGRVAVCGANFGGGYPTTSGSASPAYNGGQSDAIVTSFDPILKGVELLGSSTPACLGPLNANATEMPAAGSGGFGFYCSAAPPLATGWLVVGIPATTPVTVLGAEVWIDLTKPWRRRPVHADPAGWVEAAAPLTHVPAGAAFAAQLLFVNPPTCPGAGTLSASNAVTILVQ